MLNIRNKIIGFILGVHCFTFQAVFGDSLLVHELPQRVFRAIAPVTANEEFAQREMRRKAVSIARKFFFWRIIKRLPTETHPKSLKPIVSKNKRQSPPKKKHKETSDIIENESDILKKLKKAEKEVSKGKYTVWKQKKLSSHHLLTQ